MYTKNNCWKAVQGEQFKILHLTLKKKKNVAMETAEQSDIQEYGTSDRTFKR